jgi:hypothetical protein
MFLPVYLAALAAVLFYALLPVVGAFITRRQWRQFRTSVTSASGLPELRASAVARSGARPERTIAHGEVDAIGGRNELWIAGLNEAFVVDLRGAWIYVLTGRGGEDRIERRLWRELQSIGPGTRVFVAGTASLADGRIVIGPDGKELPLVILHDGDHDSVIRRAVWAGRHENEYWNPLAQISLAMGAVMMSGILPMALPGRVPSLIAALTLTLAFSPMLVLLPPGVVGFLAYRRFWKKARYCRARRDTDLLDAATGGRAGIWQKRADITTTASVLAIGGALAVNGWLAVFLLRRLL